MSATSSSVPLSLALHEHTRDAHSRTEESDFVTSLMRGQSCHGAYATTVSQHLAIYRAMESTLWQHYRDDPLMSGFLDPRLNRVEALEHDLVTLLGPQALATFGTALTELTPATQAYVEALNEGHTPERMLANHYVRYLGDLSGGQIVATLVQRHYGIDDEAITFYRSPASASPSRTRTSTGPSSTGWPSPPSSGISSSPKQKRASGSIRPCSPIWQRHSNHATALPVSSPASRTCRNGGRMPRSWSRG